MEERLNQLFYDCIKELKSIGIDLEKRDIGMITISLAKRKAKRYGCCKQENPDTKCYHIEKRGRFKFKVYDRFKKHNIEISKWVMELDDEIIKNTIIHEIIHCFPGCNNHGINFKKYATCINQKLGYCITRLGNKENDFKKSNLEFVPENLNYKYKIECINCGQVFFRQRLVKNFVTKFRCGKCKGKLRLERI